MATNARNAPLGEMATVCVRFAQSPSPGGGRIAAFTVDRGFWAVCRARNIVSATQSRAASAATRSHGHHARRLAASMGTVDELLESDGAPSANARAEADWKRCL